VLSDEIYSRIIFEGEHHSISTFPGMRERTIILDGFSKTYAMTGWRLGYGVMPEMLAEQVAKLQTNANSCTASFPQRAGIVGLKGPQEEVGNMVSEFKRRIDVTVEGLNRIEGFKCLLPRGAFYVFPNVKALSRKSQELEDYFLNEAGVAMLSGTSFGAFGEGYMRLSCANSVENIREALGRIEAAVKKIG